MSVHVIYSIRLLIFFCYYLHMTSCVRSSTTTVMDFLITNFSSAKILIFFSCAAAPLQIDSGTDQFLLPFFVVVVVSVDFLVHVCCFWWLLSLLNTCYCHLYCCSCWYSCCCCCSFSSSFASRYAEMVHNFIFFL